MNNKFRSRIFVFTLCFFTVAGCNAEKCVVVVNGNGAPVSGVSLLFSSIKELNATFSGNIVTTFYPFYVKNIGVSNEQGQICFENHVYSDSAYLYRKARYWTFEKGELKSIFLSFSDIPDSLMIGSSSTSKEGGK